MSPGGQPTVAGRVDHASGSLGTRRPRSRRPRRTAVNAWFSALPGVSHRPSRSWPKTGDLPTTAVVDLWGAPNGARTSCTVPDLAHDSSTLARIQRSPRWPRPGADHAQAVWEAVAVRDQRSWVPSLAGADWLVHFDLHPVRHGYRPPSLFEAGAQSFEVGGDALADLAGHQGGGEGEEATRCPGRVDGHQGALGGGFQLVAHEHPERPGDLQVHP